MFEFVSCFKTKHRLSPLALSLAKKLNKEPIIFELGNFSDTETDIKFAQKEKVEGKGILLLFQFNFERSINDQILELLFVLKTLKKNNATSIKLFVPYLPYSRQEHSNGTIELLMSLLKDCGVSKVLTVSLHNPEVIDSLTIPISEIRSASFWASHIESLGLRDSIIVSPDHGGRARAIETADILGTTTGYIEKERFATDKTKVISLHGDVNGKTVILLDDIVDTATTAINACDALMENGATKVIGCFVHGVLSGDAKKHLEQSKFDKIFVTDTLLLPNDLGSKISVLSANELLP